MKNKNFSKLLASSAILSGVLLSSNVFAVGTEAGTTVENTATVSFSRGGSSDSEQASISFNVDEIINVNVTGAVGSSNITNGDTDVSLSYIVTNTGNGPEKFKLSDAIGATNDLPIANGDLTVYWVATALSDGSFDPNNINENLYIDDDINILNDESITVYIVTNIPNGAAENDLTDIVLTAVSQTEAAGIKAGDSSFGTVFESAGVNSTNAILAVNQGRDDASSELKVTTYDPSRSLEVSINKTILGSSALINNSNNVTGEKIPGAMVTYFIKVLVENDTATALSISDIIPADMTYVAASLRKQEAANSTINIPNYIAPALPAGTPAT
ncbi:MAG: hypothetical protein KBT75_17585, partial [Oleispira antarctica]|nr:hypothetical protein [Oleispira antarctica]